MRLAALLALALATAGCPERTPPPRGVALTWRKPEGTGELRAAVDRRLAQLGVKATLQEDARTLTVRVPEGGDVAAVKAVVARRARLRLCAHDGREAQRWCADAVTPPLSVAHDADGCHLVAPTREALTEALSDAGVDVVLGAEGPRVAAWPVEADCLEPRVAAAALQPAPDVPGQVLSLQFDRAGAADFARLTTRLVGRRLVLVLDDEVLAAPLVQDAITGGKTMLLVDESEASARLLAAALTGGALPVLVLSTEQPFGPPSLR